MKIKHSSEEIVEVVDENLNIIYEIPKKEAHEKGLLHKCVIAEVINSEGKIMLIRPYSHKQDAGQFVSPVGGHVTAGEKDEDALKREVLEEIGIKQFDYRLKGKKIFDRHVLGRWENHYFLIYEIFTDEKPILGDEAETLEWFTKEKLRERLKQKPEEFGAAYFFILENFYPELISK